MNRKTIVFWPAMGDDNQYEILYIQTTDTAVLQEMYFCKLYRDAINTNKYVSLLSQYLTTLISFVSSRVL